MEKAYSALHKFVTYLLT